MSPPLTWTIEPSVIAGVVVLSAAYAWAWRRARQPGVPHPPSVARLTLFIASMVTIVIALLSPIDGIGDRMLSFHMVQHLLLIDVFPVLFILSLTKTLLRPVTRKLTFAERHVGPFAHPVFALFLYIGVMGFWHIPRMYDLTERYGAVHVLEHSCFIVAGTLYWWHLLSPIRARMALRGMGPIVYMSVSKFFVGMLGVVLAFAPHPLYPWYQHHVPYWGISVRGDQSVAGAIMMIEQSVIMGTAVFYVIIRMLRESETDSLRTERRQQRKQTDDAAWASYRKQLAEHRTKQTQ